MRNISIKTKGLLASLAILFSSCVSGTGKKVVAKDITEYTITEYTLYSSSEFVGITLNIQYVSFDDEKGHEWYIIRTSSGIKSIIHSPECPKCHSKFKTQEIDNSLDYSLW